MTANTAGEFLIPARLLDRPGSEKLRMSEQVKDALRALGGCVVIDHFVKNLQKLLHEVEVDKKGHLNDELRAMQIAYQLRPFFDTAMALAQRVPHEENTDPEAVEYVPAPEDYTAKTRYLRVITRYALLSSVIPRRSLKLELKVPIEETKFFHRVVMHLSEKEGFSIEVWDELKLTQWLVKMHSRSGFNYTLRPIRVPEDGPAPDWMVPVVQGVDRLLTSLSETTVLSNAINVLMEFAQFPQDDHRDNERFYQHAKAIFIQMQSLYRASYGSGLLTMVNELQGRRYHYDKRLLCPQPSNGASRTMALSLTTHRLMGRGPAATTSMPMLSIKDLHEDGRYTCLTLWSATSDHRSTLTLARGRLRDERVSNSYVFDYILPLDHNDAVIERRGVLDNEDEV